MKKLFLLTFILASLTLNAENNTSKKTKPSNENNTSVKEKKSTEKSAATKEKRAEEQLKEQMKREEQYAKEQTFHQGKNYDLSSSEVDPSSLDAIPIIEPDYSFNMDDVYD